MRALPVRNVRSLYLKLPVRNVRRITTMNESESRQRARITAMLLRVISELAGGDPELDRAVAEVLSGVIEICHRSKVKGSANAAQVSMQAALDLVTDKDWLLTIKKAAGSFEFEAKFGTAEMKSAELANSVAWVAQAGVN
jgi:hypothetical protein